MRKTSLFRDLKHRKLSRKKSRKKENSENEFKKQNVRSRIILQERDNYNNYNIYKSDIRTKQEEIENELNKQNALKILRENQKHKEEKRENPPPTRRNSKNFRIKRQYPKRLETEREIEHYALLYKQQTQRIRETAEQKNTEQEQRAIINITKQNIADKTFGDQFKDIFGDL